MYQLNQPSCLVHALRLLHHHHPSRLRDGWDIPANIQLTHVVSVKGLAHLDKTQQSPLILVGAPATKRGRQGVLFFCLSKNVDLTPLSSSASGSSTEDDDDTDSAASQQDRGRSNSHNGLSTGFRETLTRRVMRPTQRLNVQQTNTSSVKSDRSSPNVRASGRTPFTRSRSPAVYHPVDINNTLPHRSLSPSVFSRYRQISAVRGMLPEALHFRICIPFTCIALAIHMDARKAGESLLLLGSLFYAAYRLSGDTWDLSRPDDWISIGWLFLDVFVCYMLISSY